MVADLAANVETTTKKVKAVSYRHVSMSIGDVISLLMDKVSSIYQLVYTGSGKKRKLLSKKQISSETETLVFQLNEVNESEISKFREMGIPSIVLKLNGTLYHSEIPENVPLLSVDLFGTPHMCALPDHVCSRLSAASDENGGCEKVRNKSRWIEKYPWIISGYETFNTKNDVFFVVKCSHYEKCPPKKKMSPEKLREAKLALAQFMWEDVSSLGEVERRKEENKKMEKKQK